MLTLGGYETTPPKPSQKLRVSGTEDCPQTTYRKFLAQRPPRDPAQTRNSRFLAKPLIVSFWHRKVCFGLWWVTPPPGLCIGHEPSLATFAKPETPIFWHGDPLPKPEIISFSPYQKLGVSGLGRGSPNQKLGVSGLGMGSPNQKLDISGLERGRQARNAGEIQATIP